MSVRKTRKEDRLAAIIAILTVVGIWGLAGPVIVWTLQFIPPFTFLFLRFLIASIVVLPFALKARFWREITRANFPTLLGLSFLGTTFGLGILFYGYQFTNALDGSLITLVAPLLIIGGGGLFLKEEITSREKIGLVIAFAGSVVTLAQPLLERGSVGEKAVLGNLLVLLYHISWAAYVLWNKKIGKKFSTLTMTAAPIFISVPLFASLALVESHRLPASTFNLQASLPGIVYMAILSYIVAFYLYDWAVRRIEVSEAALYGYLQPIFAFPAAYLLLGETPTRFFIVGAVLIGLGIFLTEYKTQRKQK